MDDRYDNYARNLPNREGVPSAAVLAERAMQAVRATLEKNVDLLGGSSRLMPASTVGSSYNNPRNSRGDLEINDANLEVCGSDYRSLPQGQLGFAAEGRGDSGWGENSQEEAFRTGIQKEPMWADEGDGRIDRYQYNISQGNEDYGFQYEQSRFQGMYDNYASNVNRVDRRYDNFYPPEAEQYESAGGFPSDSRDYYQTQMIEENRNFPTRQFDGYGRGRGGGAGRGSEFEGFGQGERTRLSQGNQQGAMSNKRGGMAEHNREGGRGSELEGFGQGQRTRLSQGNQQGAMSNKRGGMAEHNREGGERGSELEGFGPGQRTRLSQGNQQGAMSNKRGGMAEHNSGSFNQPGAMSFGKNDGAQANTRNTSYPNNNNIQQQTESEVTKDNNIEEEEEGDEEDSSFCKLCNMPFDSAEKYFRHTRGLLHTQRKMAADAEKKGIQLEKAPEPYKPPPKPTSAAGQPEKKADTSSVQKKPAAATSSGLAMIANEKGDDEEEEEDWDEEEEDDGQAKGEEPGDFHCTLCDIATTGAVSLRSHLNGRNHKLVADAVANGTPIPRRLATKLGPKAQIPKNQKPLPLPTKTVTGGSGPSILVEVLKSVPEAIVGLKQVKEYQVGRQPSFYCITCDSHCDSSSIQTHLIGSKHRMKYLRDAHPDVYQHVKTHGGKKSQLSAFLEEVCTDIEQKVGRGEPIMEAAEGDKEGDKAAGEKAGGDKDDDKAGDKPADKAGEKKTQEKKAVTGFKDERMESGPPTHLRNLPHEVVIARYKEEKRRKEMMEQGLGPDGFGRGMDGPPGYRPDWPEAGPGFRPDWNQAGPGFRPDWNQAGPGFGRGRGGPGPWNWDEFDPRRPGPDFDRRFGPDFDRRPGPDYGRNFGPQFPGPMGYERGGPFPPFEQERRGGPGPMPLHPDFQPSPMHRFAPPLPPMSEEERYRRMYAYERHNFFYPEVGISPDEARARMFYEYDQLGIPYKVACDRILLQENRRMRLLELVRDGIDFDDACNRVIAAENRRQLIREYERQGLTTREAKYRVIVEEERRKLFEDYEHKGISPQEARRKIMAGEDRMHLIREYERHGIPPEMALERAIAEEERFKNFEESIMRGQGERGLGSSRDNELDDIAERNMLEAYMEQGIGREEAENKVIALLRQQGVPFQEAVKRVRSIVPKLKEKRDCDDSPDRSPEQSRDYATRRERSLDDSRTTKRERNRDEEVGGGRGSRERDRDDDDRGGSRRRRDSLESSASRQSGERSQTKSKKDDLDNITPEEAKERLLKEYEKRGISREDACKLLIAELIRSGISPEEAERRFSNTKTRSYGPEPSSSSRSGGLSKYDIGQRSRSRSPEGQHYPPSDDRPLPLGAKSNRSRESWEGHGPKNKQPAEQKEPLFRPTLTLGEELRMKRKREALLSDELSAVRLKLPKLLDLNLGISSLPKPPAATATAAEAAKSQPAPASMPLAKPLLGSASGDSKTDVSNLFESLTSNLISSEDDAAMALQVSKALTSALLKYRLKPTTEAQASKSSDKSFVEKRIEDAKKLFQTKMTASGSQFPPSQVSQAYASSSASQAAAGNKAQLQPQQPRGGSAHAQAENFGLPPRKTRVTFDPSAIAQKASQQHAAWPQDDVPPPPPEADRKQKVPPQTTGKMQNVPQQKPSSKQQLADASAAKQPVDPMRLLYEAQRQQRMERLSSISQAGQSGANHNIVVKPQNFSNKLRK